MNLSRAAIAAAVIAASGALAAPATAQEGADAFGQGRVQFLVTAGRGYAFDETYLILGAGLSYYVLNGLSVGFTYESWNGTPDIDKTTISTQYVFRHTPLKPYLGAFYRRTEIAGLPDLDSVGARAGVHFHVAASSHIGIGLAYESYRDCSKVVYRSCEEAYPEVSFLFAF
jgi:hypothetical protein